MNFSEKLRVIRKNEGLSQEQLAEKIGVSRQAITKWETGKGLPDVENMVIIAEIFKMTLDELLRDSASASRQEPEKPVFVSETIYDIDCEKHFDINIGNASVVTLSSGTDEKLHIRLSSETLENLDTMFKVKLDERKNKLDVNCLNRNRLSRYEAEDSLRIEMILPDKYSDHCEIEASVKLLIVRNLHLRRLEYDGDAKQALISNSSGSFEFTSKTDYDITVDQISGRLDIHQWNAKAIVHIPENHIVPVINKGRKCDIYYVKDGDVTEYESHADDKNELSVSGISSELVIDLIKNDILT